MRVYPFVLALLLVLALPAPAHAYLDPGTGSMLVSALVGIVATVFFLLKGIYYKGTGMFYALGGRRIRRQRESLVFYSEGTTYWNSFRPVLEALSARGERCSYLTSDEHDPGLSCALPGVNARYIGTGNRAFSTLNMLEADILTMTTPGLDVLQIRRSPGVRHYAHIVHAMGDMAFYKLYSFDYYDSVLCSGAHQIRSLRALEALRHTPEKALYHCGCPYFDVMAARLRECPEEHRPQGERLHILVAPTWNREGLLTRYGRTLLEPLARSGHEITIRPHPQSRLVEKALLAELAAALAGYDNVRWDNSSDGLPAMRAADVLVSDYSGIIFDFAFLMERPVLTMAFEADLSGMEGMDLPWPAWSLGVLNIVGRRIQMEDVPRIPQIIQEVASDPEFVPRIRALRERSIWNFGHAGPVIADTLLHIREELKKTC